MKNNALSVILLSILTLVFGCLALHYAQKEPTVVTNEIRTEVTKPIIVEKEVVKEVPITIEKEVPVEKVVEKVVTKEVKVPVEVPVEVVKEVPVNDPNYVSPYADQAFRCLEDRYSKDTNELNEKIKYLEDKLKEYE